VQAVAPSNALLTAQAAISKAKLLLYSKGWESVAQAHSNAAGTICCDYH